jgi:hypothetical protein
VSNYAREAEGNLNEEKCERVRVSVGECEDEKVPWRGFENHPSDANTQKRTKENFEEEFFV